jgi:ClpX C4-type zinc finger protein
MTPNPSIAMCLLAHRSEPIARASGISPIHPALILNVPFAEPERVMANTLIAGPGDACICSECVALCQEVLSGGRSGDS